MGQITTDGELIATQCACPGHGHALGLKEALKQGILFILRTLLQFKPFGEQDDRNRNSLFDLGRSLSGRSLPTSRALINLANIMPSLDFRQRTGPLFEGVEGNTRIHKTLSLALGKIIVEVHK
jgi:hypothetical protein